ncbi:MAG: SGNH/GDSL hydrolase family protein [Candidatus Solibacter sp.]|jgi:lysophospholipase L1-like esterase
MKALPIRWPAGLVLLAGIAAAQGSDLAARVRALEERLAAQRHALNDFGGLIRYGSEDAELGPPKPGEDRVVFLGDDVTDLWGQGAAKFFPGKAYVNRGIARQTSAQMLVRFRQDVVALKPRVVVIEAGINDLLVASEGVTAENFLSMMDIAKANGIRVVLASVTPVCDCYTKQTGLRPQGKIISLNGWIKDFAAASGAVYLNYYSALADGRNFKKELTNDGLLPNDAGYGAMAPLAEKAVAEALGK